MPAYQFMDAAARHRQNPDTFELPTSHELDVLRPGDFIKIGVEYNPCRRITDDARDMPLWVEKVGGDIARNISTERFWVKVNSIMLGRYHGEVNNDLVYTAFHGLRCGDPLSVERRHILATMTE